MKRARVGSWLLLAAALILGACTDEGLHKATMRAERDRWLALGVKDYAFVWYQQCFCGSTDWRGVRVEVRDGVAQSAVSLSTGMSSPRDAILLEETFTRALQFATEGQEDFSIEYDLDYHYIRSFKIYGEPDLADGTMTLEVRCFSLDAAAGCAAG